LWDDRLAEVWAAPGKAGGGVVLGPDMVLTARHVVAGALSGGRVLARVVRPGVSTAAWHAMRVRWEREGWDLALLVVDHVGAEGEEARARWQYPSSPSPVIVRLGTAAERDCEAVGFPDAEVQKAAEARPGEARRQSEQAVGTLLSAGQGKAPAHPRRWIPLDVETTHPGTQAGWQGISGGGVVLADGRLAGVVVAAESGHQQARLYVVPLAEALADAAGLAGALAPVLGSGQVAEVRDAPLHREILEEACLGPDGLPIRAADADLAAFRVKPAGVPGEPPFLGYIPRDDDQKLADGLRQAERENRVLLVVGGSAAGKSRSAAEAARRQLGDRRLLCPRQTALARLRELDLAGLGPVLVWLDDAERYDERAFRDTVDWLRHSGVVVVATIRRTELETRMPKGNVRNPLGEALTDEGLVIAVPWEVRWSDGERARFAEQVTYPPLRAWVAVGKSPGAWVVAGPALVHRLELAKTDDEWPARYALVRTVLDWYRTDIGHSIPAQTAVTLTASYLGEEELSQEDIDEEIGSARAWALESVIGAGRKTSQSLLSEVPGGGFVVHEYVRDADQRDRRTRVPEAVWRSALDVAAAGTDRRFEVGVAAYFQDEPAWAEAGWRPLAEVGDTRAMYNLGVLLADGGPATARDWFEKAAEAGHTGAMHNLGVLLADSEPETARDWYEKAARADHTGAMTNLGALLADTEPETARDWYEKAAQAGDAEAMYNLGLLLADTEPETARDWFEKAARAGVTEAMHNLGALLADTEPETARDWYEKAAEAGHTGAMTNLGALLADTEPETARDWYEKAARAGHTGAMTNLGLLLEDTEPETARDWYEKAARAGDAEAMTGLGLLLADTEPETARDWFEKAAEAGHTGAMYNLGVLLADSEPETARDWFEKAARAGHAGAMYNLGALFADSEPETARDWYEKAARVGVTEAMANLGLLLADSERETAREWYEKAARVGHTGAMYNLGVLLQDSEPETARDWYEKAARAGHTGAM